MRVRVFFVVVSAMTWGLPVVAAGMAVDAVAATSVNTTPPPDVKALGDAQFLGATNSFTFNEPIAGIAGTRSSRGYWLVARDGGIFAFGDAHFYGSMGGTPLNQPVVGLAATPTGNGYWLVARDGGIFSFGDAHFYGSMGGTPLNQPVVGLAATPTGNGYWLAARDGGIFSFGDAHFYGSMGGTPLNQPVVGLAATPTGNGYWLAAGDGGVFSFGDAHFYGPRLSGWLFGETAVGIAARPQGDGYWLVTSSGGVFPLGGARPLGDAEAADVSKPVVGIASTRSGAGYWVAGRGTPSVLPAQVTVIRAGHGGGSGEIALDWTGVPGATGYRIERADTANGPFSIAADLDLTTGTATMVGPGVDFIGGDQHTFYPTGTPPAYSVPARSFDYVEVGFRHHYFRVTAHNGNGDGASSVVVCGTPFGDPPC